ncbi:MAG: Lrp/AsnC family transcriptional regulator [Nitrospirota bacterium]|jgi:DNA-binding Lrp family transcriptional regulator
MNDLERRLLDGFQRDFPLSPAPYADIAAELAVTEEEVLDALRGLSESGAVSRVGPVFRPHTIGSSTLAAMAVPAARLAEVASVVTGFQEVNHNYEREHRFNLWFVVTGPDDGHIQNVLTEIETQTGLPVLYLPMAHDYHIDLAFPLHCA